MKHISINFFKLYTNKNSMSVSYLEHEYEEQLSELREKYSDNYFVHSHEKIYCWGNNEISTKLNTKILKNKDKYVFLKILTESLLKQFYKTPEIFKIKKKFQLFKISIINNDISEEKYNGLNLFKTFSIHFTPFYIDNQLILGFTISFSISQKIIWNVNDFKNNGVAYDDLEYDSETGEIFTNQKSIFRLAKHYNYSASLKKELDNLNSIKNEYYEINNFVKKYFLNNLKNFVLPNNLKINSIKKTHFEFEQKSNSFQNKVLKLPELYYYKGNYPRRENTFNNRYKIKYNKPFTFDEFENKDINIALIYPKSEYIKIATFFKNVQEEIVITFKIKKDKLKYEKFEISDFSLNSYLEVLPKIKNIDLVIVLVNENQEVLEPNSSPYYICKSKFLERGINTQEVQIEQINKFLSNRKDKIRNYTDHNIALNIYAKLGGTAWTIKPTEIKNELIFGIGATTDDERKPILGLTSIFQGNGKYLFGKVSTVTSMDSYKMNLENIISTSIKENIENGIIDTKKEFLLIFHIFKTAGKNNEIKALQNVLKNYSQYNFKYSFIHIGLGHNYRFFTYNFENNKIKINNQNTRGTYIKANDNLVFLNLQPNNSNFIKIETHSASTFNDLEYISNQVYQLTEMSHTSYNKSGRPITIKYPNLMASFAEKLKEIDGFIFNNIEMENNSLWFI